MAYGIWQLERSPHQVNCVVAAKAVRPSLRLDAGTEPPPSVEIRRSFELWPRRVLAKLTGAASIRPQPRGLATCEDRLAVYEPFAARMFPPYRRPTLFEFCDPSGSWDRRSELLQVFQNGAVVTVNQSSWHPYVAASYAGAEGRAGIQVQQGEEIKLLLNVCVDPDVEPFAFSPVQGFANIAFEDYLETSIVEVEAAMEEEKISGAEFRAAFEEDYSDFLAGGAGQIYASFDRERVTVTPEEPSQVKVTLNCESEGAMPIVFGARDLHTGEVTFSELLPLVCTSEKDAARAAHEQAAQRQAILKRASADRPRL